MFLAKRRESGPDPIRELCKRHRSVIVVGGGARKTSGRRRYEPEGDVLLGGRGVMSKMERRTKCKQHLLSSPLLDLLSASPPSGWLLSIKAVLHVMDKLVGMVIVVTVLAVWLAVWLLPVRLPLFTGESASKVRPRAAWAFRAHSGAGQDAGRPRCGRNSVREKTNGLWHD